MLPASSACRRQFTVIERSLDLPEDPSPRLFDAALSRLGLRARRTLAIDATPEIAALPALAETRLVAIQGWRPLHDALCAAGVDTRPVPTADDHGFDIALVRLGRSRVRNLGAIALGLERLGQAGTLIVAGANACGPASHARLAGAHAAIARFHGRVFWLTRGTAPDDATLARWRDGVALARVPPDLHYAAPGGFAWERIDAASALLAAQLPPALGGRVADLGAGWGFLSLQLAARCPGMTALDLYEADHAALEAARRNLVDVAAAAFHWTDVTRGLPRQDYDAVVTNPPFHDDRAADPSIGRAFIRAAADALRPGGRLWLVANRRLPYEAELRAAFAQSTQLAEAGGYKLLTATR